MRECVVCTTPVPETSRGVTCSFSCRAKLREQRKTREWRTEREYPADLVERVRRLYLDEGMTIAEVQAEIGPGLKAQLIIARTIPQRRPATSRNQSGEKGPTWRGDEAGYKALHLRIARQRGKPTLCEECGTTEGRFEWANLTGDYADVNDYRRMCVPCHRAFDFKGRRPNGQFVSAKEVMPHV